MQMKWLTYFLVFGNDEIRQFKGELEEIDSLSRKAADGVVQSRVPSNK